MKKNTHTHDGECYPAGDVLLNPGDEFYREAIRLCPYCLVMNWHLHLCHHHEDEQQSTTSA